jgi:hypothetical protein
VVRMVVLLSRLDQLVRHRRYRPSVHPGVSVLTGFCRFRWWWFVVILSFIHAAVPVIYSRLYRPLFPAYKGVDPYLGDVLSFDNNL